MKKLKFAAFGAGFWAYYQLCGWQELEGVECVAIYNRSLEKAEALAKKLNIPKVYEDPEQLLDQEPLDFVDIITDVDTHLKFAEMSARRGLDVVCQKPLAASLTAARQLAKTCNEQGVRLFVNENFRWQAPIRRFKQVLDSGTIGEVFKARASFCSAFPVFDNQPFLAELDNFILTDVGSHVLDVCRFLFGEASSLYCKTKTVNPRIKGEDVANVLIEMGNSTHCYAEMSYASILEKEAFPQMLILAEGDQGSVKLDYGYKIKTTTRKGTQEETVTPRPYPWMDPAYAVAHSSIVDAQRDILNGLRGSQAETTGDDNMRTVKLVWDAYASAEENRIIHYDK